MKVTYLRLDRTVGASQRDRVKENPASQIVNEVRAVDNVRLEVLDDERQGILGKLREHDGQLVVNLMITDRERPVPAP